MYFQIAVAVVLFVVGSLNLFRALRDGRVRRLTFRQKVLTAVGAAGALNFVAFMFVSALLGGDALSGRIQNGHYFLGNHGVYTEVSHAVFVYSACHAYSVIVGIIAALVAGREFHRPRWWPVRDKR